LSLTAHEKGESALLAECRQLVEDSYEEFLAGNNKAGRCKLQDMERLLKKLPSK